MIQGSYHTKCNSNITYTTVKIKDFSFTVSLTQPIKYKLQHLKQLFVGAKAFMRAAKQDIRFVIYITLAHHEVTLTLTISDQYK